MYKTFSLCTGSITASIPAFQTLGLMKAGCPGNAMGLGVRKFESRPVHTVLSPCPTGCFHGKSGGAWTFYS